MSHEIWQTKKFYVLFEWPLLALSQKNNFNEKFLKDQLIIFLISDDNRFRNFLYSLINFLSIAQSFFFAKFCHKQDFMKIITAEFMHEIIYILMK